MPRVTRPVFVATGLLVALLLVFSVAPLASDEPDGLERVALDQGFAEREAPHALGEAPTAGYAVDGVEDGRLSTALAGLVGVTVTFAIGAGLLRVVARTRRRSVSPLQRSG